MRKWGFLYIIQDMSTAYLSVIVIDKHPLMRAALSTTLASVKKVKVLAEYARSSDALEKFRSPAPNMIFLGVGNPGDDELATINALRTSFPGTHILALITGELQGQEKIALQYGADSVLEKSISRQELLSTLEAQLKNHFFYKENSNVQFQS